MIKCPLRKACENHPSLYHKADLQMYMNCILRYEQYKNPKNRYFKTLYECRIKPIEQVNKHITKGEYWLSQGLSTHHINFDMNEELDLEFINYTESLKKAFKCIFNKEDNNATEEDSI